MRPGLDHYFGRPFEDVIQGTNNADWAIQLEGGVLIRNKDRRRTAAPTKGELAGISLLSATFNPDETILHFGTSNREGVTVVKEISLEPTKYTLSDPLSRERNEIFPQKPDPDFQLPRDPSPERVQDRAERAPRGAAVSPQEAASHE